MRILRGSKFPPLFGLFALLAGLLTIPLATSPAGASPPTISVGNSPTAVAVDASTDTVYVANSGDGTVSVINGADCNGTSGCSEAAQTVTLGGSPQGLAVNEATNTIYVSNSNGYMYAIDGTVCDGTVTCMGTPQSMNIGGSPSAIAVNPVTDSIYVTNGDGYDQPGFISVINGATCNGTSCSGTPKSVSLTGEGPFAITVDPATNTVYAAAKETLTVINGAKCNGTTTCSGASQTVSDDDLAPGGLSSLSIDQATDTLWDADLYNGTVSSLNVADCDGTTTCPASVDAEIFVTNRSDTALAVDDSTDMVYASVWASNSGVQVLTPGDCDGPNPPCGLASNVNLDNTGDFENIETGDDPLVVAVDATTNTVYVTNEADGTLSILPGAVPSVEVGINGEGGVAVDDATDTAYVADGNAATVSMIDTDALNTESCTFNGLSGCPDVPSVYLGGWASSVAVDDATDTAFVVLEDNDVAMINLQTCNVTVQAGCSDVPPLSQPYGRASR